MLTQSDQGDASCAAILDFINAAAAPKPDREACLSFIQLYELFRMDLCVRFTAARLLKIMIDVSLHRRFILSCALKTALICYYVRYVS